jgi:aryl-alcohol dehydrogenase-like predicted oxidoreductase
MEEQTLGRTGKRVCRIGVSASYGVPAAAVERAFEQGVNYLYWGSYRRSGFGDAIRHLASKRDRFVLTIQSYLRFSSLLEWSLERALRELKFDYADVLLLGMWNRPVSPRVLDAARRLRERGLVKHLGVSTHKRSLVPKVAAGTDFDVVHFRYNAAHPGAESDIFPHIQTAKGPGMVAFTATSWKQLLSGRKLPRGERVPTATDCYRFVLSRPEVDVCMTGPSNAEQMEGALQALRLGPMNIEELEWMRRVGKAVSGKD